MKKQDFLYCYKMTYDTGFAPNPKHGILTLATCKPTIRRCAKPGTWISGWTAVKVNITEDKNAINFGNDERLIYLAKISKSISYADYWNNYEMKRPKKIGTGKSCDAKRCGGKNSDKTTVYDCGDNIYEPVKGKPNAYIQHANGGGHGKEEKEHDLNGEKVLICEEFYYFGAKDAVQIKDKGFDVPRCKKMSLDDKRAKRIIDFITQTYTTGINPKHK